MSVGTIGKISYGRQSIAEQAIKLEEALDKQTEKKVKNMRPVMDFNGTKYINVANALYVGLNSAALITQNTAFIVGRNLIGVKRNELFKEIILQT